MRIKLISIYQTNFTSSVQQYFGLISVILPISIWLQSVRSSCIKYLIGIIVSLLHDDAVVIAAAADDSLNDSFRLWIRFMFDKWFEFITINLCISSFDRFTSHKLLCTWVSSSKHSAIECSDIDFDFGVSNVNVKLDLYLTSFNIFHWFAGGPNSSIHKKLYCLNLFIFLPERLIRINTQSIHKYQNKLLSKMEKKRKQFFYLQNFARSQ